MSPENLFSNPDGPEPAKTVLFTETRPGAQGREWLQLQFELMPVACLVFGPEWIIEAWNPAAQRIFGFSAEDICGHDARGLIVSGEVSREVSGLWAALEREQVPIEKTLQNLTRDGRTITCTWSVAPLLRTLADGSQVFCALAMVQEITGQMRAEAALADAEAKYRDIFENAVGGIFLTSPEGRYLDANPALARMYGYASVPELLESVHDISRQLYVRPGRRAEFIEKITRLGVLQGFESEVYKKDGSKLWISENVRTVRDAHGSVLRYEGNVEDISQRRFTEAELYVRQRAIHELATGVIICDPATPDYPVIYCNPSFCELTGYSAEEIVGKNCRIFQGPDTDPATRQLIREAVAQGTGCSVEILNYRKDGTPFWNALTISPVHDAEGNLVRFIAIQTDSTAMKRLQEQYRQAQKMEAFGQLAGGIAHDFNNLLGVILGYSELVLAGLPKNDPARHALEEIATAGERAAGLTRQLLAFSRKQTLQPKILNLNEVLSSMLSMLQRLIGSHLELQMQLTPELWAVRGDRGQIEQVILNLVINARDAMPEGGTIAFESANRAIAQDAARLMPAGDYVVLSISDTGVGMSAALLAHIFEPFFTTKAQGQGTGLGLATCYGIVQQSGGHIEVQSEPGAGSTFLVYLPRVVPPTPLEAGPAQPTGLRQLPRGTETVLVVEDEASVRTITAMLLRELGYRILEASHGREAKTLIETLPAGAIDLVLTDVIMPEMGGKALADWLHGARPELKVIFSSGYIDNPELRAGLQEAAFLQKPVSASDLAFKVREVLGT